MSVIGGPASQVVGITRPNRGFGLGLVGFPTCWEVPAEGGGWDHRQEEWVRGDVYTNTVESAWSLLKRSIVGSYHRLSAKHLEAYLAEFEFRFNNRENEHLFRDTLTRLLRAENLPYSKLISPQVVR